MLLGPGGLVAAEAFLRHRDPGEAFLGAVLPAWLPSYLLRRRPEQPFLVGLVEVAAEPADLLRLEAALVPFAAFVAAVAVIGVPVARRVVPVAAEEEEPAAAVSLEEVFEALALLEASEIVLLLAGLAAVALAQAGPVELAEGQLAAVVAAGLEVPAPVVDLAAGLAVAAAP